MGDNSDAQRAGFYDCLRKAGRADRPNTLCPQIVGTIIPAISAGDNTTGAGPTSGNKG